MTIDIGIGKVIYKKFEDVIKDELNDVGNINYGSIVRFNQFVEVELCPPEDDGCTDKDTLYPGQAYRSGSISGMHYFFDKVIGKDLIEALRPWNGNDRQYTPIKSYLNKINALICDADDFQNSRRLKWLQFWCNKAVELYGDEAVIEFS